MSNRNENLRIVKVLSGGIFFEKNHYLFEELVAAAGFEPVTKVL